MTIQFLHSYVPELWWVIIDLTTISHGFSFSITRKNQFTHIGEDEFFSLTLYYYLSILNIIVDFGLL